jgi:hypothetical protein
MGPSSVRSLSVLLVAHLLGPSALVLTLLAAASSSAGARIRHTEKCLRIINLVPKLRLGTFRLRSSASPLVEAELGNEKKVFQVP